MRLNFVKLSPAQNTTVFITDYVDPACYVQVARVVMSYDYLHAEQLGFITAPKTGQAKLRLEMSGGEFCGNAVVALAAFGLYKGLCQEGSFAIESSGVDGTLLCQARAKTGSLFEVKAEMPQPTKLEELAIALGDQQVRGRVVHLSGISHFVTNFWPAREQYDQIMDALREKVKTQALGVIPYRKLAAGKYEIAPYVWVIDTGSKVFERACGSGSLSLGAHLYAATGESRLEVLQPGGVITVETGTRNFIGTDVALTCEGSANVD